MNARPPVRRASLQGRTVLLVEDESLIVLDVSRALEREGARVIAASSATHGIACLDAERPDAAILDLKLAAGETCEHVADRLEALGIPFIVHTGDSLRHETLLARIDAPVLQKPYPSHHLAERVAELLACEPGGEP